MRFLVFFVFVLALPALVWVDVPGRITEFCINETSKHEAAYLTHCENNYFQWRLNNVERFMKFEEAGALIGDPDIQRFIKTSEEVCNNALKVFKKYSTDESFILLSSGISICNDLAVEVEMLIEELKHQQAFEHNSKSK